MTVSANEIDSLFQARQTLLWLGIEKKEFEINSYTHLHPSKRTEFNLTSFLPSLRLNKTDLSCITQHSDAAQCFTLWIPVSSRYLASANGRWLSHWPRFKYNADIKGLILVYIKVTLHCCQCERERGPKEKLRGSQKWLAGMISFYRGYILGIRKKPPNALYSVLFLWLLRRLKKKSPLGIFPS